MNHDSGAHRVSTHLMIITAIGKSLKGLLQYPILNHDSFQEIIQSLGSSPEQSLRPGYYLGYREYIWKSIPEGKRMGVGGKEGLSTARCYCAGFHCGRLGQILLGTL